MNIKEFENRRWDFEGQKMIFRHKAALDLIANAPDESNITALDLGCGDGLFLDLLRERGIAGKGLDVSEKAVERAKEKRLDASVFDLNRRLPFPDGAFDIVIMLDVLEHLYAPEDLLKEAARVSRHLIVVGVPNFSSLPARLQVLLGMVPENNRPGKGHVYWFNYSVLNEMICANSLKRGVMRVNTIMENRFLIGKIFKLLAKTFPSLFALSFVVNIEKKLSDKN